MTPSLYPWIEQARRQGARTMHLAVGSIPRVRLGSQLHPLILSEDRREAKADSGALSAETVESFVETIVPPRLRPLLDREGEGEFSFAAEDGNCLSACIYRCQGRWSIVVHLEPATPDLSGLPSSLIL